MDYESLIGYVFAFRVFLLCSRGTLESRARTTTYLSSRFVGYSFPTTSR